MDMMTSAYQAPETSFYRSVFDRNHTYKTALNEDYLYPIFFDEVLPGDTHILNATMYARLTTLAVPIMDNLYLDTFFFYVPYRLIWDNFRKFMGEQANPGDSIDYLEPQIVAGENGFLRYGLMDYFSIPPAIAGLSVSAKFSRAYNLIWNEWFRDENLQNSVVVDMDDGPDSESDYVLLKRGKRGDYMTTCLPTPQKGAGVELPFGSFAPVITGSTKYDVTGNEPLHLAKTTNSQSIPTYSILCSSAGGSLAYNVDTGVNPTSSIVPDNLYADLSSSLSPTINSLRTAIAKQQFLELDMRGGTRYVELVLAHFGVQIPDLTLFRPEYLGGSSTMVNVSPVPQTSQTTQGSSGSPQGNLSAYATFASTGNGFSKSFTEHGVIIGLCAIRSDLTYQQGVDRHFLRKTRYDYYWPSFAHLGEQGVFNAEIYAQGTDADTEVFGYQERYAEYRQKMSYITGQMRSTDPLSLDVWHLSEKFDNLPTLSSAFIESSTPVSRITAVNGTEENPLPHFYLDCYFDYTSIREIPMYGTPGLLKL